MQQLRTIHLTGQLKSICGGQDTVRLVGDNIRVLISGLASMFGPQVKEHIRENNWQVYLNEDTDGNDIGEEDVGEHLGDTKSVFLMPAVEGAGKVGRIIAGIILIVVGVVYGYFTGDWQNAMQIILAGAGMMIGALLEPGAQKERQRPDERASFMFNGAVNVIEQGGPVNLVFGRFRTGSTVVSAGIDSGEMAGIGTGGPGGPGWPGGPGAPGCVTTDTFIFGTGIASSVKVGDYMDVINPVTYEMARGLVTRADIMSQPCVRITSESGVVLECSTTAPIADQYGNEVLAPNLLGVRVLVEDNGIVKTEEVVSVEDIGLKDIVYITCENNFFLAGAEEGKHFLHHNAKNTGPGDNEAPFEAFDNVYAL